MFHTQIGQGHVAASTPQTILTNPPADDTRYHNAQIADYSLAYRDFGWRPGARLSLTARFNTTPRGTAGFGFWNHPFSPEMRGLPRLPQAAWFFYGSPPNNMPLAKGVPGYGWKAATISARRWQFLALAPAAPLGFLLMRVPALYKALWPIGQGAIAVREHLLPTGLMTDPIRYQITLAADHVHFSVEGETVLVSPFRLAGPLGFIAWIDNQYAVATPTGRFGWGLVDIPTAQRLTLSELTFFNKIT